MRDVSVVVFVDFLAAWVQECCCCHLHGVPVQQSGGQTGGDDLCGVPSGSQVPWTLMAAWMEDLKHR